ncbi:MAG: ATP-binding protein [bacterium]|nr:ATP-binding protein [bacterium]
MKNLKNSLRFRLFIWYMLSLLFLGFFIILTVHIYKLQYSNLLLISVFFILSIIGFVIIYRFTKSLISLTSQIKLISSKNLDNRIKTSLGKDEISELAITFNELLDRLDKAFKRERQFIGDVAHELKTPLSTLKSSFEVTLQKERTNEEYKRIIKGSIIETDKITKTLKDVLDLAWTEVPNESQKETFSLSEMMNEMIEIGQKLALKKQIKIMYSIAPDVKMPGFKERLGRAILNIIDNAIKYSPDRGKINISLIKEQNNALITIKDNGQGIDEAELVHIFNRFYRGSKTNKVFGAGLGLAIAKATIEIHRGVIQVKSKLNSGSTFTIALPLS